MAIIPPGALLPPLPAIWRGAGQRIPLKDYAIIFGAAVYDNGRLSPVLARRVAGALAWARAHPETMLVPTGGLGPSGLTEAEAMLRDLMIGGIEGGRIIPEIHGRDTLESVRLCDAILRRRGDCGRVVICTSPFHQPRCALLFRLLGYKVIVPDMPADRGRVPWTRYARYVLKEILATPYDTLLVLLRWR
jgi:vancomycin permeability regulator SanA